MVTVRGREDVINRIDKIIAAASPVEEKGSIDGDFSLMALDSERNSIEGVVIVPPKVHVTIPQVFLPSERVVQVEVIHSDKPAAPYRLLETTVVPNQLTIVGTGDRVAAITAIKTETLSIHDFTATTTITLNLILPPDVQVRDLQGKPITDVKATFVITKAAPEPATGATAGTVLPGAKHDGPNLP